jgi:hypothetical protein
VVVVVGAGDMPPSNFLHRLLRLLIAGAIFCFKKNSSVFFFLILIFYKLLSQLKCLHFCVAQGKDYSVCGLLSFLWRFRV